jgi:hypothetical protein
MVRSTGSRCPNVDYRPLGIAGSRRPSAPSSLGARPRGSGLGGLPSAIAVVLAVALAFLTAAPTWAAEQCLGAGTPPSGSAIAVVAVTFYAWYYSHEKDKVCYNQVKSLPVPDDQDPYPDTDVVLTIRNAGSELPERLTAQVSLSYYVIPYPSDSDSGSAPPQQPGDTSAGQWLAQGRIWRVDVPLVEPRHERPARVGTRNIWDDARRYSRQGLWPSRARFDVTLISTYAGGREERSEMSCEVVIDLGC